MTDQMNPYYTWWIKGFEGMVNLLKQIKVNGVEPHENRTIEMVALLHMCSDCLTELPQDVHEQLWASLKVIAEEFKVPKSVVEMCYQNSLVEQLKVESQAYRG